MDLRDGCGCHRRESRVGAPQRDLDGSRVEGERGDLRPIAVVVVVALHDVVEEGRRSLVAGHGFVLLG